MLRIGILLLALAVTPAALADSFRCGVKLVTDGDPADKVVALCGEPTSIVRTEILRSPVIWRHGRPYRLSDELVPVSVEHWTYNLGPQKLMRRLRFEDGILVEVETLGPGYLAP